MRSQGSNIDPELSACFLWWNHSMIHLTRSGMDDFKFSLRKTDRGKPKCDELPSTSCT